MGNSQSNGKNNKNTEEGRTFNKFDNIIDYIATYYILTMDFQSLKKLYQKEYCDKLIILTSEIIDKYFTDLEVTYISQRIKNGQEVNELSKEKVMFFNREQLDSLDIKNDKNKNIKKRGLCIGISKFYIKIAHLFAAIVMTINPIYVYKDVNGNTVKSNLYGKDKIPKNVPRRVYKLNICNNRIQDLKKGQDYTKIPKEGDITIAPRFCDVNINRDGSVKTLAEEPGIPELLQLYLDDKYDYNTGNFTGMTAQTEKQFKLDLKQFYTVFTGNKDMPDSITKFSDIKLRDYQKQNGCKGEFAPYKQKYSGNIKDKLFSDYANNIKTMIQNANSKQENLLKVINIIFSYVTDPYTGKKRIRINPKLTEDILQKTIQETRSIIVDLYLSCETDYLKGIKLFEVIVEDKILKTTQNQIKSLETAAETLIDKTKEVTPNNEI
jgi:hypothetical protein